MSYLQAQSAAFFKDAASASTRLPSQKRAGVSPASNSSRPSPAPSSSAAAAMPSSAAPRTQQVYSQPPMAATGAGKNLMTQVTMITQWLRDSKASRAVPFQDIADYLSLHDEQTRLTVEHILRTHSKVEVVPAADGHEELFRFRPIHNVRSADDLISVLQSRTTAEGIPMKELRDGWAAAFDVVNALEAEGRVLVTRNKKDNVAKRVWPNDPSLIHTVDEEFVDVWAKLKPPADKRDLRSQLVEFGLTPTSVVKVVKPTEGKEKKKRTRRSGKETNSHMRNILKNYDHLKK